MLEALPALLATYERAVLARWALASTDEERDSAGVLSSLLDALGAYVCMCMREEGGGARWIDRLLIHIYTNTVAAAQALRPFRLAEAAVWRILARLKQRVAAAAVAGDLVAVGMEC